MLPIRSVLSAALAAAVLHAPVTHALSLTGIVTNGNEVGLDFSTAGHVAADIGFHAPGAIHLTYLLDGDDVIRGGATFDSIIDNFSTVVFGALSVAVDGGRLGVASFASNDGGVTLAQRDDRSVRFAFAPSVTTQVYLGNAFDTVEDTDWSIAFDGLAAGDTVTLSVAAMPVPEPATIASMLVGLGLFGLFGQRRR